MKQTNFNKAVSAYGKGQYAKYSSKKEMDLYIRGKGTDNGNEVISVTKTTQGVMRLCNYGQIKTVQIDNLQKDICYAIMNGAAEKFVKLYGKGINLDNYSIKGLKSILKNIGGTEGCANAEKKVTNIEKEKISEYLFRENGGDISFNVMTSKAGKTSKNTLRHPAKTSYLVTEKDSNGEIITKTLNSKEFDTFNEQHIVKVSSGFNSNRFAANSSYVAAAEAGYIINNNRPAETSIFKMKLKNLTSFNDIYDEEEDEGDE